MFYSFAIVNKSLALCFDVKMQLEPQLFPAN